MRAKANVDDRQRVHALSTNKNVCKKNKKSVTQCKEMTLKSIGISILNKVFNVKNSNVNLAKTIWCISKLNNVSWFNFKKTSAPSDYVHANDKHLGKPNQKYAYTRFSLGMLNEQGCQSYHSSKSAEMEASFEYMKKYGMFELL
jgi:hypothetical protein